MIAKVDGWRFLVICLGLALLAAMTMAGAAERPNIVFIFADDLATDGVGVLGNEEVSTPNLDRLAREGLIFTNAYNQGSYSGAVCVASRTMLNTGRFLWRAQKLHKLAEKERQAGRFWSEYLKGAGYETYMTGKWHVKAIAGKAFDHVAHERPGMPNQTKEGYNRPIDGKSDVWSPWDTKFGGFWKGGKHWSEVLADDAVGFIKGASRIDRPFFMYLAFNASHDPRQSPRSFVEKYPLEKVSVPTNYVPEYPYKDAIGCGKGLRDERLAPFPRTEHAVKVNRSEYYAIITHMDEQIGRILSALRNSGKEKDTYVFFTSDHGLAVGHHGLLGKQNLFEHSVKVPFFAKGPGVAFGKKIDVPIYLRDVMPTTLELAGVDRPDHVQFKSLVPFLRGGKAPATLYDAHYGAYLKLQRSVTQDGFKLVLYPKIEKSLLFDLRNDPLEMNDVFAASEHAGRVRRLFARLRELQKETGDELDLAAVYRELAGSDN